MAKILGLGWVGVLRWACNPHDPPTTAYSTIAATTRIAKGAAHVQSHI
jgi:hypothetical protein